MDVDRGQMAQPVDIVSQSPSRGNAQSNRRMASLDARIMETPQKAGNPDRFSRTAQNFARAATTKKYTTARPMTIAESGDHGNDATFRRTGLSVGVVAGTQRSMAFGFDNYTSPKIDTKYRIAIGNTTQNSKLKNFADLEAKGKAFIPGPKYVQHSDWRHNIKGRTGKFLGAARTTFSEEIMNFEKKKPAPSKYHNAEALKKRVRVPGNYLV